MISPPGLQYHRHGVPSVLQPSHTEPLISRHPYSELDFAFIFALDLPLGATMGSVDSAIERATVAVEARPARATLDLIFGWLEEGPERAAG